MVQFIFLQWAGISKKSTVVHEQSLLRKDCLKLMITPLFLYRLTSQKNPSRVVHVRESIAHPMLIQNLKKIVNPRVYISLYKQKRAKLKSFILPTLWGTFVISILNVFLFRKTEIDEPCKTLSLTALPKSKNPNLVCFSFFWKSLAVQHLL